MDIQEKDQSLKALARKIEEQVGKSDQYVLEAATLVGEARKRVESGEVGKVSWQAWAEENINLSATRLKELMRIAKAKDAAAELKRQREGTKRRVAAYRASKAAKTATIEPERKELIQWARTAQIENVCKVLAQLPNIVGAEGTPEPVPMDGSQQAA